MKCYNQKTMTLALWVPNITRPGEISSLDIWMLLLLLGLDALIYGYSIKLRYPGCEGLMAYGWHCFHAL